MTPSPAAGLVYIIATGTDAEAVAEGREIRSGLERLLPAPAVLEDRELPGVLWGYVPTGAGQADRLDRATSGSGEAVLRGDPVWLEPVSPRPPSAAELLARWERDGERTAELLDNIFLAVISCGKTGELVVVTDPTGGLRLFETQIGRSRVLATSYGILSRLAERRAPDNDAVATFFHLGYFPGRRTALRAVSVHPFGSITRISGGGLRTHAHWRPRMTEEPRGDLREVLAEGVDAFNATVREQTAGRELAYLAMTAGLDSRTVLSSLIRQQVPFKTYTHGFPGCWEGTRVRRIVENHGVPHRFVPLERRFSERLGELALESFRATEGEISSIEKSHLLHVLSLLREEEPGEGTALLLGGGAGMLKGTFYRLLHDADRPTPRGIDAYVRWNLSRSLPPIFAPEIRVGDPGLLRDFVSASLEEAGGGSFFQRLDYFYLVRYRRWAGAVKSIYRRFFPVREPFVSRRLLDYLFPVDPPIKKAELPHFEILSRNFPALQLDLTNKMSPALPFGWRTFPRFLPSGWWRLKQVLRGFSRRYLPRELFRLVDYVDYREWIRGESGRQLVEGLLDPPRMESSFLYDRGRLAAWIAGEAERGFPAFPLIDRMCTLELYFRSLKTP